MRRILHAMMEVRLDQLRRSNAANRRFQEVRDLFAFTDRSLSGISPTSPESRLQEVMTSADFGYAIEEYVQRMIWAAYEEQTFRYDPLVRQDTLPNYLPVSRLLDQAGVDDLEYAGFKAPARAGSRDDLTPRSWQVYPWKKQFDFSHETLVNDDLGFLSDQVQRMGRAARRTLEKFVSRMYSNATTIARLVGLGALYSTTGRLSTTRISTARMAFNQRTNARGERILAPLTYLVYHTGLADTVATIQNSTLVPELATNAANVVKGTFTPIEDPYLTGAAPNLPWYAFSSQVKPFVLARMAGHPAPVVARKSSNVQTVTSILGPGTPAPPIWGDFETGNIVLMVWDIWGTYADETEGNLVDYRGAYYSSGTSS